MVTYNIDVVVTDPILQDVSVVVAEASAGVLLGGLNRYVLTKNSDDDNDASWKAPGGFTFVQDTTPTPTKVGDTFFNNSTGSTGGYAYVAIDNGSGGLIWVQYSPSAATYVGPRGLVVPPAVKTATEGGFVGSLIDVSTLTLVANVYSNRYYSLELMNTGCFSTVANDICGLYLYAGATQIGQANFQLLGTGQVNAAPTLKTVFTIATGSVTFKVKMIRNGGTGSLSMYSATGWQPTLVLKDEGPV